LTKKTDRGASHSGFHFYNLFQLCQLKFAIQYYLRIFPVYTASPLINGSAFHEGKATFYLTRSKKKALEKCKAEILPRRNEFEFPEDYEQVYLRCPTLLEYWIEKYGYEVLEYFKPFCVEKELKFFLKNGTKAYVTLRPDTILESKKTGKLTLMETKTSSFSKKLTIMGVENGDQATTYWIGAKENFPDKKIEGIICDVAYWNKAALGEDNIECLRSDPITRSKHDERVYKLSVSRLFYEMSTKIQAVKAGYDPYGLFARNTHYCNSFFKPCEYIDICRRDDLFKDFRHLKRFNLRRDRQNPLKTFSSFTVTNDNIT
jgi:hypothetical protein